MSISRRTWGVTISIIVVACLAAGVVLGLHIRNTPVGITASGQPKYEQTGLSEQNAAPTANETERGTTTAPKREMPAVPIILQNPELPAGCEATSAAMLLQTYGFDYDKEEVARSIPAMPLKSVNGVYYGPDPNEAFCGSPFDKSGYGVYSKPMAATMQQLINMQGGGATVRMLTGGTEQDILDAVDNGSPVMIWATMFLAPTDDTRSKWNLIRNGEYTDEVYKWLGNEHCLVLVGHKGDTLYLNDPLASHEITMEYDRATFFARWEEQGKHAIVIEPY